ncbi:cyclic nucleotide-gated ion channel 17-like [Wolffia australiana]
MNPDSGEFPEYENFSDLGSKAAVIPISRARLFSFGEMISSKVEDEERIKRERRVRFDDGGKQSRVQLVVQQLPKFVGFKFGAFNNKSNAGSDSISEEQEPWRNRILDPGSEIMLKWNWAFLAMCLVALFVDPLYFYLPSVDSGEKGTCIRIDRKLSVVITVFRSIADVFYILHIVIKFRTAYVAPSSRVFGRGELVMDPKLIAERYLRSDFAIDLVAALPLPQIVIWLVIPAVRSSKASHDHNALALIVLLQYVPRLYLIFPLSNQIIKATGVVTKTAWAGAAYNLLLYMLASHVLGASWYVLSIDRQSSCWESECRNELIDKLLCRANYLDCNSALESDRGIWREKTNVFARCNASDDGIQFQFGIFSRALSSGAVSSGFVRKYLFCLWWGLQNLSSYGQNLVTSTFIGETLFAILIAIVGLILFAQLIGNMQTYLQSITIRLEEWRLKRRDTEEWMRHRQLPPELRTRVRQFVQYKWLATRGVNEESILQCLPTDLRRDIKRHLCLDLVRRVPFFAQMDDQLLDAICEHLVSSLSTEGTIIVREGDPVSEMLFIIRGRLESCTTNGGRTGFFNSIILRQGEFCGEELLTWALDPKSSASLPQSTRTVRALVEVEGFALGAEHLKQVANQFRRLHSKRLQHTFRVYSHHWRNWAACFIQAAWRRFKRRKMAQYLSQLEESTTNDESGVGVDSGDGGSSLVSPSGGPRRGSFRVEAMDLPMLKKPEEPDFSCVSYT